MVKARALKTPITVDRFWLLPEEETETFIKVNSFLNNSENNPDNSRKKDDNYRKNDTKGKEKKGKYIYTAPPDTYFEDPSLNDIFLLFLKSRQNKGEQLTEDQIRLLVEEILSVSSNPDERITTMYVYKPMHGYNLMQAIARVNRVFKDKEGGLIVDYVGIASALKAAMKEYTKRDQSRYGDMNIAKVAYPKFQEKLQVCKDLLYGFDFSGFIGGSPLTMAKLISGGVNFVLDAKAPDRKDLFLKEAMLLKQSHSLCSSMTTERERHEAAYMEAVRSTVIKITWLFNQ